MVPVPSGSLGRLAMLATAGAVFMFSTAACTQGPAATPTVLPTVVPAEIRLLEPTLPPQPSEADRGSQVYWLYCMPCHGDRGQGLTDEFREVYPPEDRSCWDSGCHGKRPYEGGFTLPTQVPGLIGKGALGNFASVSALDGYIRAAMPRQAPGSLAATQYDQVISFLARENGLEPAGSNEDLTQAALATPANEGPAHVPASRDSSPRAGPSSIVGLAAVAIGAAIGLLLFLRRRRPPGVHPPR